MKMLWALLVGIVAGCAPPPAHTCPTDVTIRPTPGEEPKAAWRGALGYSLDQTSALIAKTLNDRDILSYYWKLPDFALIRTGPMPEPSLEGFHRRSFVSVRVLGDVPSPNCTNVEVRFYIERQKFGEYSWVRSVEGADFAPLVWKDLAPVLREKGCVSDEP